MGEPGKPSGGAMENRIKGFQQQGTAKDIKRDHRAAHDGGHQLQVRRGDAQDVAKQKMREVQAGGQPAEQRDADGKEHQEQRAKGGILLHHGEAAHQRTAQRREKTGQQRAHKKRPHAGAAYHPSQRDAGQQGMRQRVTHERHAPQHKQRTEQPADETEQDGRGERPAHKIIPEGLDEKLGDRHDGNTVVRSDSRASSLAVGRW